MSQSPLHRSSTRRSLPTFAHVPSKLSKPPSTPNLAEVAEDNSSPSGANPASASTSSPSKMRSRSKYTSTGTSTSPEKPSRQLASATESPVNSSSLTSLPRSKTNGDFTTPARQSSGNTGGIGTDSKHRPHTPIHYSPFALSTPPAPLSKSASIPFDMAASARAARIAREKEQEARDSPVPQGKGGEKAKSKRFVRRRSLAQRMVDAPTNLLDRLIFSAPTSMEEIIPPERYAHPIALVIHAVHFLCLAPLWRIRKDDTSILRSSTPDRSVGGRWDRWEEETKSGWRFSVTLLTFLLLILALGNAVYLFTRFRTYDMQLRSANDPLASPNASPAPKPQRTSEDPFVADDNKTKATETASAKALRLSWTILRVVFKGIFAAVESMMGYPSDTPVTAVTKEDRMQTLHVWDPPDFCLAFFCAYPPFAPLLSHILTAPHPFLTPLLHLSSAMLLTHLALSFRQLVKDRMVLSAEVMHEYNKRFVYKKIFGGKMDRGVQTNEVQHRCPLSKSGGNPAGGN